MWPFARQIQKSDTVAVFTAKDRAYLLLAQSPLDSTGLRYLVTGDFAQSIFTTGRIGTGWNLAAGPPTIWVFRPDIYEAQEILFYLADYRPSSIPSFMRSMAVVIIITELIFFIAHNDTLATLL
jgi:hypothetical protein